MEQQPLRMDDCIENIIKFYSHMVYRLAFSQVRSKSDADDIFQEVFLRYIKKQPDFETEEHRKAWLIRVTINCSKKFWNSSWIKRTEHLDEAITYELREENDLDYELKKLSKKYRTVIHLFYYEELSIAEMSVILNQKPSTIRTQLTRARRKLKEILEEDYNVKRKIQSYE